MLPNTDIRTCPEANTFALVIERKATPEQRQTILAHIRGCDECWSVFSATHEFLKSDLKVVMERVRAAFVGGYPYGFFEDTATNGIPYWSVEARNGNVVAKVHIGDTAIADFLVDLLNAICSQEVNRG
jgi:hypothetical protein